MPDEFEFFELPPELAWLKGAASLPGAVPPEEDSIRDDEDRTTASDHTPLNDYIGCPSAAVASGFSRGGSRASTPESIAELEPVRFASPTPNAGMARGSAGTRVFASASAHGSARTERGAIRTDRAKALAPGRSRVTAVHDPWSWRD